MCADHDRGRQPEPHFAPLTEHAREQRESGRPGGGAGRRDYVGGSGVYPASLGPGNIPRDAEPRTPAAWGQGERGAAGYEDAGRSELFMYGGQLLGGYGEGPSGQRPSAERPSRERPSGEGGRERRRGPRESYGMPGHGAVGGPAWSGGGTPYRAGRERGPERGPERLSDAYDRPMVYDRESLQYAESHPGPLGESYGPVRWEDADPRLGTRRDPSRIDMRGAMRGEDYSYARALGPEAFRGRPEGPHAGRGPKGYRRPDERIREDVCEALTEHPAVDASGLEVEVREGVVTLRGGVEDRRSKRLAVDIAESVAGVTDVQSEMRVPDDARR